MQRHQTRKDDIGLVRSHFIEDFLKFPSHAPLIWSFEEESKKPF